MLDLRRAVVVETDAHIPGRDQETATSREEPSQLHELLRRYLEVVDSFIVRQAQWEKARLLQAEAASSLMDAEKEMLGLGEKLGHLLRQLDRPEARKDADHGITRDLDRR
jgi:hypothetical protein